MPDPVHPGLRWAVMGALAGLLAGTGILLLRAPGQREEVRPYDRLSSTPAVAPSPPLPVKDPAPASPSANSEAPLPGRISGRVVLPFEDRRRGSFFYQIYAFFEDGGVRGPEVVANSSRFSLMGVPAGRVALLFYSASEDSMLAYQVVSVPAGAETEVVLRPAKPYKLHGQVVDANGLGLGGIVVAATETTTMSQELYVLKKPANPSLIERRSSSAVPGAEMPPTGLPLDRFLKVDLVDGSITRGVMTDAQGRFAIPLTSSMVPVPVRVTRDDLLLKEETLLPLTEGVRIVVPNQ